MGLPSTILIIFILFTYTNIGFSLGLGNREDRNKSGYDSPTKVTDTRLDIGKKQNSTSQSRKFRRRPTAREMIEASDKKINDILNTLWYPNTLRAGFNFLLTILSRHSSTRPDDETERNRASSYFGIENTRKEH